MGLILNQLIQRKNLASDGGVSPCCQSAIIERATPGTRQDFQSRG